MGSILVPNVSQSSMTLLSATTLSGSAVNLTSIPQTYLSLRLVIRNFLPATDNVAFGVRINQDSTASRHRNTIQSFAQTSTFNQTYWEISGTWDNAVAQNLTTLEIPDYTNTTTWKIGFANSIGNDNTTTTSYDAALSNFVYNQTSAVTSLSLITTSGNFTSGTVLLYGVK